jgi:RNA polymerase sigma-70 factor (ECF subfamily)
MDQEEQKEELDILQKIAKNDRKVFEQVFKSHYTELCRFAMRYVREEIACEEIVQEVFISIWERRAELNINSSIKAYLFTAVRNRSFNYIKLQLPKEHQKTDVDALSELQIDNNEDDLRLEELKAYVNEAIDLLPRKCKAIFILSRTAGMTYREIADEMDISVKTVENQVGLALKKLREQLNPIWEKVMLSILFLLFIN